MVEKIAKTVDLKKLNYNELSVLCDEIRKTILDTVSKNGGHLASNLGIVELTVALHRVFDLPEDKIIFDVGHQCYAHKILSGRYDEFDTLRKCGGISGFTNRFESEFDALTAGHSGPSISSGMGLAVANKALGKDNFVVSVVGDGSFTNGMIYEALNNCCKKGLKFIIILNDNEMSISSNVGNLAAHFSKLRTSKGYFLAKSRTKKYFKKIPFIGDGLVLFSGAVKNCLKRILIPSDGFFSALDIKHIGPVDGHDIERLEDVLNEAKKSDGSCLVLVKTKKGKGYSFAEEHPENYHSVGKFELDKGACLDNKKDFSAVFGKLCVEAAEKNDKITALTAAMCDGTGLCEFSKKFPDRFFDVGIAEEHQVAFSSGLALGGLIPVCAVYSTFSQRVYDQIIHDFAVQKLHCVLALDRAGFVASDGITHQGLFDVSLFSSVPGCKIYSPDSFEEMEYCFTEALNYDNVCVVRFPKGCELDYDRSAFEFDKNAEACVFGDDDADTVIITYGRVAKNAYDALCELRKTHKVKLIKLVRIYPFDFEFVSANIKGAKTLCFVEEGIKSGGISEKISSVVCENFNGRIVICAVDNEFAFHASVDELYDYFGMSARKIIDKLK